MFLAQQGISPYQGHFHEPPVVLLAAWAALSYMSELAVQCVFILVDVLVALQMRMLAGHYADRLRKGTGWVPLRLHLSRTAPTSDGTAGSSWSSSSLADTRIDGEVATQFAATPDVVLAWALLNPFTLLGCVAQCTVSFSQLAAVSALVFASQQDSVLAGMCVALASYLDPYNVYLLAPVLMLVAPVSPASKTRKQNDDSTDDKAESENLFADASYACSLMPSLRVLGSFVASIAVLFALSCEVSGGWSWLRHSYGFLFVVDDATPNVGIFWYFVTEMFDRFLPFFLFVLHAVTACFVLPLTWRIGSHNPLFVAYMVVGMSNALKAYPVSAGADCRAVLGEKGAECVVLLLLFVC